jgi:hypothetical protein
MNGFNDRTVGFLLGPGSNQRKSCDASAPSVLPSCEIIPDALLPVGDCTRNPEMAWSSCNSALRVAYTYRSHSHATHWPLVGTSLNCCSSRGILCHFTSERSLLRSTANERQRTKGTGASPNEGGQIGVGTRV